MESNWKFRSARPDDVVQIWKMILELSKYEKMHGKPVMTPEMLKRDLFEVNPPSFQCLVAEITEDDHKWVFGFAIFFPIYSSWVGKSMMLESIFIKPNYRMIGAGKKLLATISKIALDSGCMRLDFHVLKWESARKFYELLGAKDLTDRDGWLLYRLEQSSMINCVNNNLGNNK